MKIVSFPHYTCGGLLCDILNNTFSPIGKNGGIQSIEHQIGKIGDSATVFIDFDQDLFINELQDVDTDCWIGTHCWLGDIKLRSEVQIINVTTCSYKSRLFRWTRAWHHYYVKSEPWQNLEYIAEIDKQRETAKNYLPCFPAVHRRNFFNIEFSDIVEETPVFQQLTNGCARINEHMSRWKQINSFLYDNVWTALPARRFSEADYEISTGKFYSYE